MTSIANRHVCVYVCMYVYVFVCVYMCVYVCVYVCVYIYVYVCVYMCIYVCICVCVCSCVCVCVCLHNTSVQMLWSWFLLTWSPSGPMGPIWPGLPVKPWNIHQILVNTPFLNTYIMNTNCNYMFIFNLYWYWCEILVLKNQYINNIYNIYITYGVL